MAVSWDVQISVTNLAERRVHVTCTRTDDVALTEWSWAFDSQIPQGTTESQAANRIVTDAWAAWQAEQTKQANLATFLGSIESLAATGLDAQEGS